jgi:hypothetical protein
MADPADMLQNFRVAALVGVYWLLAAAAPFMLSGLVHKPDAWTTVLFVAIAGYFGYTGLRAWERGWKSRFILRIVVPAALCFSAWVVVGVISWLR